MNIKKICPENIIKLSATISLLIIERLDDDEIHVVRNLLYSIANNISTYQGQCSIYNKKKQDKKFD
ncbi:MAG: hypothetical protein ACI4T1_04070 [Christensenellales bacterium]